MKLYITTPSPFARKVRIVATEKGLSDRIEEVVVDPYANAPELLATNPVVQVPTLIAEDGQPLTDSPVICEYLDRLGGGDDLLPPSGSAEWLRVKRLETLGNQGLEMGVKLVLEKRRPENERSAMWIDRWTNNMGRALDALEAEALSADQFDIGTITAGVALTWIGFRHPDYDWKTGHPNLVAFSEAIEQRPSFVATYPK
ncbi:glutathione S-transferase family protein [Brevundimonas pishanensis]|uniref:glutathione S-transferase family protein n=1 Tax=Brevundimonas pishanensis TaxID=2896315 RepID=UPI001FA7136B|nr:glutathione S-transferase N-terminal domain-containing protein [Brevundimonas pishanensis]